MIEKEFVDLVEQHRQEQLMSLPPADLLTIARGIRGRRRRRSATVTCGVLVAALLVAGAVHTVRGIASHDAARPVAQLPVAARSSGPATRLVGLNGWVVRVPASWGTDRVGCDGVTAIRPSVLFDHQLPASDSHGCPRGAKVPFVRIADDRVHGVPWRTVSGMEVLQGRHPGCSMCITLGVPSARVTFGIRAATLQSLRRIEESLRPLPDRQVTVPVWTAPAAGRGALDLMTTVATGAGLRPRAFEVPSRRPPGTFLRSDPPIGTPVDLGRSISLFFSAGDLGRYATGSSLRRRGWRIFPVATAQPSYGRKEAIRTVLGPGPHAGRHPAFLRTLTITHDGPRHVVVRRLLAWLVVTPSTHGSHRGASSITAVDATTDHVIETQGAFRGRVRAAVR